MHRLVMYRTLPKNGDCVTISGCVLVYRYTKERNINECVTTPCMDVKTIGIPPCTGTPGQPPISASKWAEDRYKYSNQ